MGLCERARPFARVCSGRGRRGVGDERAFACVCADASTDAWADAKVPTELKLALQKARNAKGISQKQLATVRATAPVVEGRTRG